MFWGPQYRLDTTMLAMERLPLSQAPFSGQLSLSSPIVQSPRAGIPAPLIPGLPSPPALHTSHQPQHAAIAAHPKVRPSSSSSLSSVQTPPPYGDTATLMGSAAGPSVYSPTHSGSLLPQSSVVEHHERLVCGGGGSSVASGGGGGGHPPGSGSAVASDPSRHISSLPSLTSLIGHTSLPIVSSAQETSCGSASSPVAASREHQSSSPSGEQTRAMHVNCLAALSVDNDFFFFFDSAKSHCLINGLLMSLFFGP